MSVHNVEISITFSPATFVAAFGERKARHIADGEYCVIRTAILMERKGWIRNSNFCGHRQRSVMLDPFGCHRSFPDPGGPVGTVRY